MREIAGDNIAGIKNRLLYLMVNCGRGLAGFSWAFRSKYWQPKSIAAGPLSPGRMYINAFLREELSALLPPGSISMLDIGCGDGYVREILSGLHVSCFYEGIDIIKHPEFDNKSYGVNSRFVGSSIEDYTTKRKFNCVFSNTALEHVSDDKLAIDKSKALLMVDGTQIHIVPAPSSLFLYLWHGYRQYTPRRVHLLFGDSGYRVYRIGGIFSFFFTLAFYNNPRVPTAD